MRAHLTLMGPFCISELALITESRSPIYLVTISGVSVGVDSRKTLNNHARPLLRSSAASSHKSLMSNASEVMSHLDDGISVKVSR